MDDLGISHSAIPPDSTIVVDMLNRVGTKDADMIMSDNLKET